MLEVDSDHRIEPDGAGNVIYKMEMLFVDVCLFPDL
jgi:hypothetical protein